MTEHKNQHDPLCYQGLVITHAGINVCMCTCAIIYMARIDEREKAAQRVESCRNKFKARDFNDAVDACAAAVRGES